MREEREGEPVALSIGLDKSNCPHGVFFANAGQVFRRDELGVEILQIALPAALALLADPIASLIDTAFIGQIGSVELAAVGVAIAVFNQVSRIAIFPLVSITTSFVAEEDTVAEMSNGSKERDLEGAPKDNEMQTLLSYGGSDNPDEPSTLDTKTTQRSGIYSEHRHMPSVSTALIIGAVLGVLQAVILISGAKPVLHFMGIKPDSPMLTPSCRYLTLRSLGAPAVLLSLAIQGIFRGFKDTRTPLYATAVGDLTNIMLDPILIFGFHLGVSGAAIAHVISQYLISLVLIWRLVKQVNVVPPSISNLQFSRFIKNGSLLLTRVIAVTFCVTLAASMATRQGSTTMAAFQICLQVWLATSLLADGLAIAGQAILASAFAERDYDRAVSAASRVLQLGLVLGVLLCFVLGFGMQFACHLFTKDVDVLLLIQTGIPFVAATQPINAMAFVFDGINFGASDFFYSAISMVLVAIVSILCVVTLSWSYGFIGIWVALTIYMSLRMFTGFWRIGTASGPWNFLRVMLFLNIPWISLINYAVENSLYVKEAFDKNFASTQNQQLVARAWDQVLLD